MSAPPPPSSAASLGPWQLFLTPSALSLPISLSESTYRLSQNLRFFLPNYVVLTLLLFLLTLLPRPLPLLLFLSLSAAWAYFFLRPQFAVFDYEFDHRVVLGFLSVMSLGAILWTGVWRRAVVSLLIGGLAAVLHAVVRAPEDSIEDSPYGSLLNVVDDDEEGARGEYARV